ncbi:polysaccharide biosynthesis tyrosine autokinase [Mycobacterium sp. EPa45]|uniref:polysaccharide biosynthesis tyrosine autokinase n=1 Tax=Mycobacterium sp. EPa45 TaxID=1545728 RepID=UPI0009E1BB42|nr:polysaccharide biosynthesis tyrosine autokinase [Mycobacterium sp. EPa45]
MNLQDYIKVLRTRWITICVTTLVAVLAALTYTLSATPQYQASTQLYVSASSGSSMTDLYQGNRLSQERVLSYTQLIMGETLAQRTIDRLHLDMSAASLRARVSAAAKQNTVLIDVSVLDPSPTRAFDIANALSDEFVQLVRELETPPTGDATPNARVIVEQRASVPTKPVTPKKLRNLVLGLAAGVMLGVGLALVRDRLDNTVKDRDTLEAITGVGLVGAIPMDKEIHKRPAISFEGDNSSAAESFRKLRTNLQFLAVDNPPRVIMVTSASPGEGKSTTAINIALALAEAEHNVVLVDGDMRRPSIDKYLDLVGAAGFSTVLSGAASLSDVLQKTAFPNLTALTSGATPPNPSELLGSQAAESVLKELREQFDYVIIDSSPLLAVTDGAILAANSDGTLIMAKYGQTKREHLAQAIGNLRDVGATVLGSVFTMTSTRGGNAYSYSYGYYGNDRRKPATESAATSHTDVSVVEDDTAVSDRAPVHGSEIAEVARGHHSGPSGARTRDPRSK